MFGGGGVRVDCGGDLSSNKTKGVEIKLANASYEDAVKSDFETWVIVELTLIDEINKSKPVIIIVRKFLECEDFI